MSKYGNHNFLCKSTISMAMFNSYVNLPEDNDDFMGFNGDLTVN